MRPEECQRRDAHGKLVDVPEHVPDPLETSVTTIYQHALTLLHTWLAYDGLPVLQALPGYSEASRYEIGEVKDVSHKDANKFRATLGERPKDSNSKGRKSGQASPSTEYGSLEDDSLPRKAAQKVANCLDIWEVLGGVPFETDDDADEESFVAPRGWQLLEVLIEAWKLDAQQYPQLGGLCSCCWFCANTC